MNLRRHKHIFLKFLFLAGIFLLASSFENKFSEETKAASTPGQQTSGNILVSWVKPVSTYWGTPVSIMLDVYRINSGNTTVIYTGEVSRQSGALVQASDVLNPGDVVTLKLIETASYFETGTVTDTPSSPWVDNVAQMSPDARMSYIGFTNIPFLDFNGNFHTFHHKQTDYEFSPTDRAYVNLCPVVHQVYLGSQYVDYACIRAGVHQPAVNISPTDMSCGSFGTPTDIAEGVRELTTTCTIGNSLTASLNLDIAATKIYQPANWAPWGIFNNPPYYTFEGYYLFSEQPVAAATLSWTFDVASVPPPPTLTFTGSPTTINQGQSSILEWSTTNVNPNGCTKSNGWTGAGVSENGSEIVSPLSTTTYHLDCSGPGGTTSGEVRITVNPPPLPSCPLLPQVGRTIKDFTPYNKVRSCDSTQSWCLINPSDSFTLSPPLPAGFYNVTLVSYDQHSIYGGENQPKEQYYLKLFNSLGSLVAQTNSTLDIPQTSDYNDYNNSANNTFNLNIPQAISSVEAWHSAYVDNDDLNGSPHSIYPVCASFEPVVAPLSVSCSASPSTINTGESTTWTATVTGGAGSPTFSWSGTNGLSGTSQTVIKTYNSAGTKNAEVRVTSGTEIETASCSLTVNTPQPDYNILSSPSSMFVNIKGSGGNANSSKIKITIDPNVNPLISFSKKIDLSLESIISNITGLPLAGVSPNFSPNNSLTSSEYSTGADFWLTVPSNAEPGVYTVNIKGENPDLPPRYNQQLITLSIDILEPNFKEE
ncbi:PKD domain-containing protein [Candidatus Giovannonibacteria bacterium]|nr:PKD domain-containing protein [Candidatus Giovannonibacteria bacterium]